MDARIWRAENSGPRVLLLHGFLGHPDDWAATRKAFGAVGEWTAPFLPGHGARPLPVELPSYAQHLAKLSGGIPFDYCIGYSLGGRLACALQSMGAVWGKLILVGARPIPEVALDRLARDMLQADTLMRVGLERFLESWYQQPLFQGLQLTDAFLARRRLHQKAPLATILHKWSPARLRVAAHPAPETIIYGAQDPVRPTGCELIDNCSHHVPEMAPETLALLLRARLL
ncbi:MAG: alpha/beta fold hydrolase [Chlamydiia bacterium]